MRFNVTELPHLKQTNKKNPKPQDSPSNHHSRKKQNQNTHTQHKKGRKIQGWEEGRDGMWEGTGEYEV